MILTFHKRGSRSDTIQPNTETQTKSDNVHDNHQNESISTTTTNIIIIKIIINKKEQRFGSKTWESRKGVDNTDRGSS